MDWGSLVTQLLLLLLLHLFLSLPSFCRPTKRANENEVNLHEVSLSFLISFLLPAAATSMCKCNGTFVATSEQKAACIYISSRKLLALLLRYSCRCMDDNLNAGSVSFVHLKWVGGSIPVCLLQVGCLFLAYSLLPSFLPYVDHWSMQCIYYVEKEGGSQSSYYAFTACLPVQMHSV